jgi:hypothetical protein
MQVALYKPLFLKKGEYALFFLNSQRIHWAFKNTPPSIFRPLNGKKRMKLMLLPNCAAFRAGARTVD